MLAPVARHAAELLEIGTTRRDLQILDLGAGSAIWSLTFAAADVGSRVTAVDRPAVLEVAQETAEQLSLADRLTTLPGDFHELPLPQGMFDLAVIANVTHLEDPERTGRLFVAAREALKPTGELLVVDVLPGDPQGDLPRALYELGLALRTENGRVYSAQHLETLLRDAGFSSLKLLPLDVPPHTIGMLLASGPRDDPC
jgi:ubiquinone/menaquinone biosynthesis C-methylase UbiE